MTSTTTASPGFTFRQNIQSLLQSLSGQNNGITTNGTNTSTTTTNANTGTTHSTNTSTITIGTTHTGTSHTTNTSTITIGTTQTTTNPGTTHTTQVVITPTTGYTHTVPSHTAPIHMQRVTHAQVTSSDSTSTTNTATVAVPATAGDGDDDDRDLLTPAWDLSGDGRLQDSPRAESIASYSPTGLSGSPVSMIALSPDATSEDQEADANTEMDGSHVAIQVSEDMVALPVSVTVQGSEVGEITQSRMQHSSQVLSAFTSVQPEMFCAWQNEIHGWQHPDIITMPYELLHYQASQDMAAMIVYFSNYPAYDIHRDDFCRNILTDPDFVQACSNVYFWCIGDCPESTEIRRSILHIQQHAPLLVSINHNASGTQMAPVVLTDLTGVQEVIGFIQMAVGVQQDQIRLRRSREVRAAQDAEYQSSLELDRARVRQREEERAREEEIERERLYAEAQQREQEERNREEEMERERLNVEANENAIREARAQLPVEPLESGDTINIRLRGPQGQNVQRTFFLSDTTEVLYRAAFALLELPTQDFRLRSHATIVENNGATLEEHQLGLSGNILLSVDLS